MSSKKKKRLKKMKHVQKKKHQKNRILGNTQNDPPTKRITKQKGCWTRRDTTASTAALKSLAERDTLPWRCYRSKKVGVVLGFRRIAIPLQNKKEKINKKKKECDLIPCCSSSEKVQFMTAAEGRRQSTANYDHSRFLLIRNHHEYV